MPSKVQNELNSCGKTQSAELNATQLILFRPAGRPEGSGFQLRPFF